MDVTIHPSELHGTVEAVSSKSEAHRLLIVAALCAGTTNLDCRTTSKDIDATADCLRALGARVARTRTGFRVVPIPGTPETDNLRQATADAVLDVGESGSTLRFMLPLVAALGRGASITGHGRLAERPLSPLYEELAAHGATLSPQGAFPLDVSSTVRPGRYTLPGNVSSQYVSGLLIAAPVMGGPVEVVVQKPVESRPYIDMTVAALATFSVHVACESTADALVYTVGPDAPVSPGTVTVGGDWSNSAFWLAAGAFGEKPITVSGLDLASTQGDRAIMAALALLGAAVTRVHGRVTVEKDDLRARTLDVRSCPDLVPPLAAVAALCPGETRVTGAARLRLKESDRLQTVSAALDAMGADVTPTDDGLLIRGVGQLAGGTVDAANDHRIAMMAAIAATQAAGPTTILGAECVQKSYPGFFDDFRALGGQLSIAS